MTAIAVAIVNWNTRQLLQTCLRHVLEQSPSDVVVADNGSTDGSVEMVRREYPSVTLVLSPENPGYGAGANRAIARCGAPCVLLLNSDTEVQPGCLETLADYLLRHDRVGLLGPRLLNGDRTLQESCFPFPRPFRPLTRGRLRSFPHDRSRRVPWVIGAALAIRRSAFDAVGGFDETYGMYYEEVDLAYRLARSGWETHFTPDAEVIHLVGASTAQRRVAMLLQTRLSAQAFFRRHHAGVPLSIGLGMEYALTAGRLARDGIRYGLTRSAERRRRLREDLTVWWHLLRRRTPTATS